MMQPAHDRNRDDFIRRERRLGRVGYVAAGRGKNPLVWMSVRRCIRLANLTSTSRATVTWRTQLRDACESKFVFDSSGARTFLDACCEAYV